MMCSEGLIVQRTAAEGLLVPDHDVLFGASLGQWNGADAADAAGRIRLGTQADRDGLDLFTVADHPYFGDKLDAYALTGFLLGQTERITGMSPSPTCPAVRRPCWRHAHLAVRAVRPGHPRHQGRDLGHVVKLGVPRLDGGPRCAPRPRRSRWSALSGGETGNLRRRVLPRDGLTRPPRPLLGCSPARRPGVPVVTGQLADG
jgi:hypothetical protein